MRGQKKVCVMRWLTNVQATALSNDVEIRFCIKLAPAFLLSAGSGQ
jgi:hypothetical protein